MKRILAILLVLCMCLPLTACFGNDPGSGGGEEGGEEGSYTYLDNVGDQNFGGAEFVISLITYYEHEVYKEEKEPDACDKAKEDRNRMLQDRFNVEIVKDMVKGQDATTHATQLRMQMMDGNPNGIDMALVQRWLVGPVIMTQTLCDLRSEVPFVKDSIGISDWWDPKMNDCYTVYGHQYVGVSDINISALANTWAIIFNRDLDKDYSRDTHKKINTSYESLYDAVDARTWTLENMYNIVKDFYIDNPQTGKIGVKDVDDIYGLTTNTSSTGSWAFDIFVDAFGYDLIVNDGFDTPTLTPFSNAMAINVVTLRDMFNSKGFNSFTASSWTTNFAEGASLMYMASLATLDGDTIHDSDVKFGILPFPMANENQRQYYAGTQDSMSTIVVPLNDHSRMNCTGAMIEALSAESHQSVLPAYYEVILKYNNTRDEDSVRMIEIIYEGRRYNLAGIHSSSSDFLYSNSRSCGLATAVRHMGYSQEHPVDFWNAAKENFETGLKEMLAEYKKLADMYG